MDSCSPLCERDSATEFRHETELFELRYHAWYGPKHCATQDSRILRTRRGRIMPREALEEAPQLRASRGLQPIWARSTRHSYPWDPKGPIQNSTQLIQQRCESDLQWFRMWPGSLLSGRCRGAWAWYSPRESDTKLGYSSGPLTQSTLEMLAELA